MRRLLCCKASLAMAVISSFGCSPEGSTIAEDALRLAFKSTRPDSAATVHGLRAAFKSWGSDMTNHPTEIVEMSLGHTVGNSVERAYRRTDLLEKRRKLMDDWAQYLSGSQGADVIQIRGAAQ